MNASSRSRSSTSSIEPTAVVSLTGAWFATDRLRELEQRYVPADRVTSKHIA